MPKFNKVEDTSICFFFNHVIMCFGVPLQFVSNHGKHLKNELFVEFSSKLGFTHEFASLYYPQSNKKVKDINKILTIMLQRTVDKHKTN